jgi:hypothetical protein
MGKWGKLRLPHHYKKQGLATALIFLLIAPLYVRGYATTCQNGGIDFLAAALR